MLDSLRAETDWTVKTTHASFWQELQTPRPILPPIRGRSVCYLVDSPDHEPVRSQSD